jgi:hypothetical protein
MLIKKLRWKTLNFFLMVLAFSLGAASLLRATTVEVENDDDDILAAPTPMNGSSNPQAVPPRNKTADTDLDLEDQSEKAAPASISAPPPTPTLAAKKVPMETPTPTIVPNRSQENNEAQANSLPFSGKRVRISDKVGFYYFVSAGFLSSDPARIPSIGTVIGSGDYNQNFSTPKRTYLQLESDHTKVKPDDLLVIFRTVTPIQEPHSGDLGFQVENLAIVKIIEIQKERVLVEVKESFRPFQEGDRVEVYENEIRRWKQAQLKKALPSRSIKCFVVGGEANRQNYEQADFIYLSAGSKKGVVEGQNFDLREITDTGAMEESLHTLRGVAQVIFSGPDSSTAQIISNHESIQKSFEAVYQP